MKAITILILAVALAGAAFAAFPNDCLSLEPSGSWVRPNLAKEGAKEQLDYLLGMVVEEFIVSDSSNSTIACPDDFVTDPSKACFAVGDRTTWRLVFDVTCPDFKSIPITLDATVYVPEASSDDLPQITELAVL